jgi:hypothetical protein
VIFHFVRLLVPDRGFFGCFLHNIVPSLLWCGILR